MLCVRYYAKAFTTIYGFINKLKLVPKQFALLMTDWYARIFVSVKWRIVFLSFIQLTTGVRQGGVPYVTCTFSNRPICR